MRIWKEQILERDGFTCQRCGKKESATRRIMESERVERATYDVALMKEKLGERFDRYYSVEAGVLIRTYKSTRLHVHHVKELAYLLQKYSIKTVCQALECEPLWDLNNGLTLCRECHYHEDFERRKKQYSRM
jgi:hypothetical protein